MNRLLWTLFAALGVQHTLAAEEEAAANESYSEAYVWDYVLPQEWADHYPACGGRQQSPIDILASEALVGSNEVELKDYMTFHSLSGLKTVNTGHGIQVDGHLSDLSVNGYTYKASHMQMHMPSEHSFNGELSEGEIHIVHVLSDSEDNHRRLAETGDTPLQLAVVGIFIQQGEEESPLLAQLGYESLHHKGDYHEMTDSLDLGTYLSAALQEDWFHYDGSLTTPPCSEVVKWFVLQTPLYATAASIKAFKDLFPDPANARPPQVLGGRSVVMNSFFGCGWEVKRRLAAGATAPWNYILPQCWKANYHDCGGDRQSPIDIDTALLDNVDGGETLASVVSYPNVTGLNISYGDKEEGDIGLKVSGDMGYVTIDGEQYQAIQFHMHFPSEHTFNGVQMMGEMHVVHQKVGASGTDDLLVIGTFITEGEESPFLKQIGLPDTVALTSQFSLAEVMPLDGNFYRYAGSLTTPPCSETVKWFVLETPITATLAQKDAFNALNSEDPANDRPIQLRHGREVMKNSLSANRSATSGLEDCPSSHHSSNVTTARRLAAAAAPSTSDSHEEFVAAVEWGYVLPQCWQVEWPTCGGRSQSPVNIVLADAAQAGSVVLREGSHYLSARELSTTNNGHGLKVSSASLGDMRIQGEQYDVREFSLHCPSEHSVDGKLFDCEMQIMHQLVGAHGNDDIAIISIMYSATATKDDEFLSDTMGLPDDAPQDVGDTHSIPTAVDLGMEYGDLLAQDFYRYDGSLTVPPCDETAAWFILTSGVKTMSMAQFKAFKDIASHEHKSPANNRPLQMMNGRATFKNTFPGCYVEKGKRRLESVLPMSAEERQLATATWGYVLPQCWANDYPACSGHSQSPINIDTHHISKVGETPTIDLDHKIIDNVAVRNTGHGLSVVYEMGGMTFNSAAYETTNFVFHFNSEHAIDGRIYPGELQIVHTLKASERRLAPAPPPPTETQSEEEEEEVIEPTGYLIVSIMFDVGEESPFLAMLAPNVLALPKSPEDSPYRPTGDLVLDDEIKPALADGFYTYQGSLTTPPCTEDVTWVILATVRTMTQAQVDIMKAITSEPANNRPLQFLHDRNVNMNYGGAIEVESNASNFTDNIPHIEGVVKLVMESDLMARTFIQEETNKVAVQKAIAHEVGVKDYLVQVELSVEETSGGGVGKRRLATSTTVVVDFLIAQPFGEHSDLENLVAVVATIDKNSLATEIADQIKAVPGGSAPLMLVQSIGSEIPNLIDVNSLWDYLLPQDWSGYYPDCAGKQQSPINIVLSDVFPTRQNLDLYGAMTFKEVTGMKVVNDGKGLKIEGGFSNVMYVGNVYEASHMYLHFPAEHAVDGVIATGELQIVHQNANASGADQILIVGVFIDEGEFESDLLKMFRLPSGPPAVEGSSLNVPSDLNIGNTLFNELRGSFWHYDGSLTTPPCSETVKWFLLQGRIIATANQVLAFESIFPPPRNNRPLQLLNTRKVVENSFMGCPIEMTGGIIADWNYIVPQCWGTLYPSCTGDSQSPIDIDLVSTPRKDYVNQEGTESLASFVNYKDVPEGSGLVVENTGRGLKVDGKLAGVDLGSVIMSDGEYEAQEFVLHFPSEHTINGEKMLGELQIRHQLKGSTGNDNLLYVAAFFTEGALSNILKSVGLPIGAPDYGDNDMTILASIDLGVELASELGGAFYHYEGSMTVPPCTEGAKWYILEDFLTCSLEQAETFNALGNEDPANARPTQLRNQRPLVKSVSSAKEVIVGQPDCDATEWSYLKPMCWGSQYPACNGRTQSPVNVDTTGGYAAIGTVDLRDSSHYKGLLGGLFVQNTGHGLKITNPGDMGYISMDGDDYQVEHLQLHCPSEHTMDGRTFDCELQISHRVADTEKRLIMAVFYTADGTNNNPLIDDFGLPAGAPPSILSTPLAITREISIEKEFGGLMSQGFYRYDGSLTQPPCTEGAEWFILSTSVVMQRQQLIAFKDLYPSPSNNRPVQLMNGRAMFKTTLPGCYLEGGERRLSEHSEHEDWGYIMSQCWPIHYPLCATGVQQSPVNIDTTAVEVGGLGFSVDYGIHHDSIMFNSREELRVNHHQGNLSYDGLLYDLHQFHFKFGSEHAIDGRTYPAELQIVHQQQGASDRNNLLVISVMYDYGPAENAFLKQLGFTSGSELPALHGEVGLPVGTIDLAAVIEPILVDGFYNYHGSITTPPCEETVGWLVMATPLEATKAQLDMGKAIFPDPRGARPLQELYGRSIGFNGKPSGYPAPLPVNTWLLEGQGQSGYFGAGLTDVDLDEASGAIRRGMFGGVFAMLLAVVAK